MSLEIKHYQFSKNHDIQLLLGEFNPNDALGLIAQTVHIKIKYLENKISSQINAEDVRSSEVKIKRLQKELFKLRKFSVQKPKV
ncbi:hypothetical protein ACFX5E_10900 [Flavobacterium sp. LS2P90]|uniref:Uncharacterized protein n=1 Tax=Flavobacterium xylosi TaxID=3230415 RepID=A0ABW6HXU9_9FLAO